MAPIDALRSPELSALLRMARGGGKPMNMREFSRAALTSPLTARKVLKTLVDLKLVTEQREKRGALKLAEIRITPAGQKVAKLVASIDALLPRDE